MRLISFQHRSILEHLCNYGIYECKIKSKFNESTPECYSVLGNRLKLAKDVFPIFAWYNVKGLPLEINSDTLERALEMTPLNMDEYYLFELDVSDEYCDLQDFYNFVDMRCLEEGIDDSISMNWDKVFKVCDDSEIQATLPYIKSEWVKNTYEVTYEQVTKKFDSSILNMDYIKKHNLSIPKTTTAWKVTNISKLDLTNGKMNLF